MRRKIIFTFLFFCFAVSFGQQNLDSLKSIWNDESISQKARLVALGRYADALREVKNDSALFYANQVYNQSVSLGLDSVTSYISTVIGQYHHAKREYEKAIKANSEAYTIAKENNYIDLAAISSFNKGIIYYAMGDYKSSLEAYNSSLKLREEQDEKLKMANTLNNIGILNIILVNYDEAAENLQKSIDLYNELDLINENSDPILNLAILRLRQGDYASAIDLYLQSVKISEASNNQNSLAYAYLNLATLYYDQGEKDKFYEYANKSLKIREELGDDRGVVKCLGALAAASYNDEKFEESLIYIEKGLPLAEEINVKPTITNMLSHWSLILIDQGKYDEAKVHLDRSYKIASELGAAKPIYLCLKAYGRFYKAQNDYGKALKYYNEALENSDGVEVKQTMDIANELYQLYAERGNNKQALKNYELYIQYKDSFLSETNQREVLRQQYKYEYDKKALKDSLAFESQKAIQQTKLEQTQDQRLALTIVLLLVGIFSVVLYGRIKVINKQKVTIQDQNAELNILNESLEEKVEERTKEIVHINEELVKSDERYEYALEASTDGIWDYNVPNDSIKFSPAIYTMLGYEPYEFPESREGIYNLLYQEDLKEKKKKKHDLFIIEDDNDFINDEYRLKSRSGKLVWIQVKGKIVERDTKGKPLRVVGTHTNITAAKMQNQKMLEAVLRTEDAERSRISKEIHDGLQQTLTISHLNFRNHKDQIEKKDDVSKEAFDLGWEYLQKSLVESRTVAHALMPKSIVDYGVLPAIDKMMDDLNESTKEIEFLFFHNLKKERLDNQQIEITIYRIVQECISNIIKYAKATRVDVQLKDYDDIYMLTVEDNGIGFDTKILDQERKGLGFRSMQNRLDAVNGVLDVESEKGRGTMVIVKIQKSKLG